MLDIGRCGVIAPSIMISPHRKCDDYVIPGAFILVNLEKGLEGTVGMKRKQILEEPPTGILKEDARNAAKTVQSCGRESPIPTSEASTAHLESVLAFGRTQPRDFEEHSTNQVQPGDSTTDIAGMYSLMSPSLSILLYEIAREGSLSRAARHLGCSAPTLRKRIAKFESGSKVSLVDSSSLGTKLTNAGKLLLTLIQS